MFIIILSLHFICRTCVSHFVPRTLPTLLTLFSESRCSYSFSSLPFIMCFPPPYHYKNSSYLHLHPFIKLDDREKENTMPVTHTPSTAIPFPHFSFFRNKHFQKQQE